MSKAFTRESDDEAPLLARMPAPLPPGVKNYMTPGGAQQLREDLKRLVEVERPRFLGKGELPALDQRIAVLSQSLQSAVVVEPPVVPDDVVRFGATVTVRDKTGEESRYRIVGIDEMDMDRDWISWRSPIAKALLNAKIGQKVRFKIPAGEQELEITNITYE